MAVLRSLFGRDAAVLREKNFQIMVAATVVVPFGNALVSPILDSLIDPFGASPATIGLIVSVFLAPGIVLVPIVGWLADRFGRKPILAPSLAVFGLAGSAIALTTDFRVVLALRLLQGIGWAGIVTLLVTSIGDLYSGTTETTAQGLRLGTAGLAGAAISVVSGVAVVVAWQVPFLFYLLAVPASLIVYRWFDEPTAENAQEASSLPEGRSYRRALLEFVANRRVVAIIVARMLPLAAFIGFTAYNSVVVVRILGGTPADAGVLFAVVSVVYATAASQVGRFVQALGGRYRTLLLANVCLGGGFTLVFLAPSLPIAGVGAVVGGFEHGLALSLYRSLLAGFAPESLRAGVISLGTTGSRATSVVTPIVMGVTIGVLSPKTGFASAVRLSGLGVALVAGGGGFVLTLVAQASPHVGDE